MLPDFKTSWPTFSGVNPNELRGSRTAVFIGCSSDETGTFLISDPDQISGYSLTGCTRNMLANRVSYVFDFKGLFNYACSIEVDFITRVNSEVKCATYYDTGKYH